MSRGVPSPTRSRIGKSSSVHTCTKLSEFSPLAPLDRTARVFWCTTGRGVSKVCESISSRLPGAPDPSLPGDDPDGLPGGRLISAGGPNPAAAEPPLRDRYRRGAVCPHGLAVATGRLKARLDRLLDRHFRCRDNQRCPNICVMNNPICSHSYAVLVCRPRITLPSGRSA